jgi:hypothetical protein
MNILNADWCTTPPHDYELKKYQLLGAIQHIVKCVDSGELFYALKVVEDTLYMLYKFQSNRGTLDEKLKILKGINIDTMSLDYEYPEESKEIKDVYGLCEFAIEEFESVFKLIRSKWRLMANKISITEIPSVRPTKTKGQVFIAKKDSDIIRVYEYLTKPTGDWKDFFLKPVCEIENEVGKLSEYIQDLEDSENYRLWRCNHTIDYDFEDCVFPITKYTLFFKIITS